MSSVLEALQCALGHQRTGRLPEAERIYRQVLVEDPQNVDALHLLGMVAHQLGQTGRAAELIETAIHLNTAIPAFHNNLGTVYQAQGRQREAVRCFERALRLQAEYPEARINLGNSLQALKRPADAVPHYCAALAATPNCPEAHNNLGNALLALGRTEEAVTCYREALRLRPGYPEACVNLSSALKEQDQLEEAAAWCRQALGAREDLAGAHANLGGILVSLEQFEEGETHCLRALELDPGLAEAYANLSVVRLRQRRLQEAAAACETALRLKPDLVEGHANLGDVYAKQGRLEEALACYHKALGLRPRSAELHNKIGFALERMGRHQEALEWFEAALRLKPGLPEAHMNRAMAWLLLGDFERGWPEYEWRWRKRDFSRRKFAEPRWDGSPLEGRTILLHAEQGFGDTLQFVRYAPLVKQAGGTVILECQPRLAGLLAKVRGVDRIVAAGAPLPPFDVQAPLLSLPHILGGAMPAEVPYLEVEAERVELWRRGIRLQPCPTSLEAYPAKVGLAWAGNPKHEADRSRSVPLALLAKLAQVPGVALYSLQRGPGTEQLDALPPGVAIANLEAMATDAVDTAAAIVNLDLVISIDSMVAHLAGALGKPVWILLGYAPDWRWLLGREDSPWYPTARLFRQPALGDWEAVIERVAEALRNERP